MTHEAYKGVLEDHFDKTIFKVFTDEPKTTGIIPNESILWTDYMIELFKQQKGYDIQPYFNVLLRKPEENISIKHKQVRIDFYDFWSQLFVNNYFRKIKRWCRQNNLLSGGHLGGEEETLCNVKAGYGHILRCLREMDLPGVDTIWREIFPGKKNHHFSKIAATAAHQVNKPFTFTESFGVYGNGLTIEQVKWITDYQYVRGINLLVMGCYPLSTRGPLMGGIRPHFGPVNPLWKYMDLFHSYVARLGYALTLGKPIVQDAIYFPVWDLWGGGNKMCETADKFDLLAEKLLKHQVDFDFIDDDILESSSSKVVNGALKVKKMRYQTIWLPPCEWLTEGSAEKLKEFAAKGGNLKCLYKRPKIGGKKKFTLKCDLLSDLNKIQFHVGSLVKIEPSHDQIRICGRIMQNGNLYLLTYEGKTPVAFTGLFKEKCSAFLLDPETGEIQKITGIQYDGGVCSIPFRFNFAGSQLVLFPDKKLRTSKTALLPGKKLLNFKDNWQAQRLQSYKVGKNDFIIEKVKERSRPIKLGNWSKAFGRDFSGDVKYLLHFKCDTELIEKTAWLDLGRVCYACEVFLNNVNLGRKAWRPFIFNVKGKLKIGENVLCIKVTNTLSNHLVFSKKLKRSLKNSLVGPYHEMALNFEKESIRSGLFGPVILRA